MGKMFIKEDCFASLSKNRVRCAVLTEKKCIGCRFYQTNAQLEMARERAKDRLISIGKFEEYAEKYGF